MINTIRMAIGYFHQFVVVKELFWYYKIEKSSQHKIEQCFGISRLVIQTEQLQRTHYSRRMSACL